MIELKEYATWCMALSSNVDRGNPLLVYLLYKHSLLETIISGDASKFKVFTRTLVARLIYTGIIYWRQHGDLASMTTAVGLHRDTDSIPKTVSIASEMRRRIYAAVFNIDKVIATLMGRPPFLSRRHSSTPLPLDLSDEYLLAGEPHLSNAVSSLDATGWNTEGQIYSTMILRARTMFAYICGDILVLALGFEDVNVGGRVKYDTPYFYCSEYQLICPES
jgi:hypothetical protein